MTKKSDLDQTREESEKKQRGILWADMLRQSRSIDEFLWKGDRKAKPIQRAALVLYSIMFLSVAVAFVIFAWRIDDDWLMRGVCIAIGCLFGAVGFRFMRNAFLHVVRQGKDQGDGWPRSRF
jgi:hypothetical protein